MDSNYQRFQERLGRMNASADVVPGSSYVQADGLVVQKPRRKFRIGIPWRSLMLIAICGVMLKGFLIWHMGDAAYAERLRVLQEGDTGAQIASRLLSMDPVSAGLAGQMTAIIGPPPQ